MYRIYDCITQEHEYWLLLVAAVTCFTGAILSVRILRRVAEAQGQRKRTQLVLSGLVTGATIWSTHFIAMLSYDSGVEHGYHPTMTAVSLFVAIFGAYLSNAAFIYANKSDGVVMAGCGFGITVSVMHYVGMSAITLPGEFIWSGTRVAVSVLVGSAFGIGAYHRIAFPVTRYCWLGGACLMVLAGMSMHFSGMAAFEIRLDSSITMPPRIMSDTIMALLTVSVVGLVMFVGFYALSIETEIVREARKTHNHALNHDQLTGLPNRQQLNTWISDLNEKNDDCCTSLIAIASIDLDVFQQVNDAYGHDVGDRALIEIAARMKSALLPDEFLARVGGDEFVIIKSDAPDLEAANTFAHSLLARINAPIYVQTGPEMTCTITLGASIGLCTSAKDGVSVSEIMRKSNLALYRSKHSPAISIFPYDEELDRKHRDKTQLISDLRHATEMRQFEVLYQLQNDTHSREIIGCEALLRWHHPTQGTISPAVFIPLAEESGLIHEIGHWVLETACDEAASWARPLTIAVNVAPQQLAQPAFSDDLRAILEQTGLSPHQLELEVTEASVIHDKAFALRVLKEIKKMGVRIAMDDFGTGYSSLATLQTFPFDKIKIDRSFVTDLHKNPRRAAIVRSTLSLGEAFDIPVLAEGVETEDELKQLQSEGCHFVQGFLFGKPKPASQIRALIGTRNRSRACKPVSNAAIQAPMTAPNPTSQRPDSAA